MRVGGRPVAGAEAPNGTPNAGTVYVPNADGTLTEFLPDGQTRSIGLSGSSPQVPVVAPAGTPNAGNVYIVQELESSVVVLRPNGSVSTIQVNAQNMHVPAVPPAGLSGGGTIYIPDDGYDPEGYTVITISPDGSVDKLSVGLVPQTPVVGSPNTPIAGNIYIPCSEDGTLWILKPDGSTTHIDAGSHPGAPALG